MIDNPIEDSIDAENDDDLEATMRRAKIIFMEHTMQNFKDIGYVLYKLTKRIEEIEEVLVSENKLTPYFMRMNAAEQDQ
jgi:hypothetical protein